MARYDLSVLIQTTESPTAATTTETATGATTPPVDPSARQAVGRASSVVLVTLLLVLTVTCVLILLALRRRSRSERKRREADLPTDAWAESARRLGLEDHPDIPREPGTE